MNKNNPQRLLTGSLLFAALVLVCLSASPYRSYERARSSAVRDMRALELSGAILQLDEVLTMSARMAAVTGDLAWEKRYRKHEPELDAAIAELSTLAKGLMLQEFAQETGAANRQLVSMENSAFRLVHQGRLKEASAVMLGNNYLEQKKMYAKGLEKFLASLKEQTKGDWRRAKESSLLTTIVSLVFILILFAVWAAIVRLLRDVRRKDEKTATYLELEHVVASILAASSDPVELAPKIIEAVCSVLGWDFGAWWLIDRDCGELYCSAQWHAAGMDGGALFKEDNAAMVFKSGVGLPGRVWASGRAAWIEDVVKETWFRRLSGARQLALRGACGFPIMVNDEILGIVEFFSRKTIAPDQKILETLDSLCKQIGQRIKRMQVDSHVMQIQKMDAIGRLAGGVAHDFNNNLSCILGLCNLLMKQLPPGSGAGDDVAEIRGVAERSALLTKLLLSFSRRKSSILKIYDANELLAANGKILSRMLGSQFRLVESFSSSPLPILSDPGQFSQILMNLTVNARDAMPLGGDILLSSTETKGFAEITFKDSGAGITKPVLARMFEPFFTTKEPGKGTGLGLSIIHGIVTGCGGTIEVESEPGRGTLFRLRFALAQGKIETVADANVLQMQEVKEGLILLVEDDPGVLRVMRRTLEGCGYRVLPASSPEDAMTLFNQRSSEIALVITDINMPQTNGVALARRLWAVRAQTKVLFVSGYGLDILTVDSWPDDLEFLAKPISPDVLAAKVNAMLTAGTT